MGKRSAMIILGILVAGGAAAIIGPAATAESANPTLKDGSFETTDLSDSHGYRAFEPDEEIGAWKLGSGVADVLPGTKMDPVKGKQFLNLVATKGKNGSINQTVETIPGKKYVLAFNSTVLSGAGIEVQTLTVQAGEKSEGNHQWYSIDATGLDAGQAGWHKAKYEFTAKSTKTTLSFTNSTPTTDEHGICLDDITFSRA
ncbi:MAG TPA: DUF642 domain-containing protein [Stackebrandtia sp.]|jgi:hypothetical protein|uniref:DUF642 domain-containing protein n=1 Tax=Stackebrandtia sp. TaxID=2023065 RepID=UPI002D49945C|nr:DUF642 domain-containing protein [Stackebrandtia sp.]HZE39393.1 DUF642 domain-containing protein [Stackebrandtia sp.]